MFISMIPLDNENLESHPILKNILERNEELVESQETENILIETISRSLSETNLLKRRQNESSNKNSSSKKLIQFNLNPNAITSTQLVTKTPTVLKLTENLSPKTKFYTNKKKYSEYIMKLIGSAFIKKVIPKVIKSNAYNKFNNFQSALVENTSARKLLHFKLIKEKKEPPTEKRIRELLLSNQSLRFLSKGILSKKMEQYINDGVVDIRANEHDRQERLKSMSQRLPPLQNEANKTSIRFTRTRNNTFKADPTNFRTQIKTPMRIDTSTKEKFMNQVYTSNWFRIKQTPRPYSTKNSFSR